MDGRNTTETRRLKTAASARWNDERSAKMWGQYADDITRHEDRHV